MPCFKTFGPDEFPFGNLAGHGLRLAIIKAVPATSSALCILTSNRVKSGIDKDAHVLSQNALGDK
jgi:hypothetical protein